MTPTPPAKAKQGKIPKENDLRNQLWNLLMDEGQTTIDQVDCAFKVLGPYLNIKKNTQAAPTPSVETDAELQRLRGFILMYLDHGRYKDDPETRKLFMQFAVPAMQDESSAKASPEKAGDEEALRKLMIAEFVRLDNTGAACVGALATGAINVLRPYITPPSAPSLEGVSEVLEPSSSVTNSKTELAPADDEMGGKK